MTDDVVVHPLSPTYMSNGETANPCYAMEQAAKRKHDLYAQPLAMLRCAQAVTSGLRKVIFRPCAFTSLGALSPDSVKFVNGAAGWRSSGRLLHSCGVRATTGSCPSSSPSDCALVLEP